MLLWKSQTWDETPQAGVYPEKQVMLSQSRRGHGANTLSSCGNHIKRDMDLPEWDQERVVVTMSYLQNGAKQRLRSDSTWREEDTGTVFWKVEGSCKQGPDCSQCPIWVWRDSHLTLQERRSKLCFKGKLLKVRFANHLNGWCGACGKKLKSWRPLKLGRSASVRDDAGFAGSA